MRLMILVILFVCINVFAQNRISLSIDMESLDKEIKKIERSNNKNIQKRHFVFRDDYTRLDSFYVFYVFYLSSEYDLDKQDHLDYSFLNKLDFYSTPIKYRNWHRFVKLPLHRKVLYADTFLVSPEGEITYYRRGHGNFELYPGKSNSLRQLGMLIVNNKIDFAFYYVNMQISGYQSLCLAMNDTVYLVENFPEFFSDEDLKLIPIH